jgi:hypothetical protein
LGQTNTVLNLPPIVKQTRKMAQRQGAFMKELTFQNLQNCVAQSLSILLGNFLELLLGELQFL